LTINFYLTPDDDGVTQTTDLAAGVICQRYHAVWSPTAIMGNIMAALGGYLGFKGERLSVNSITTNWRLVALTDGATYANLAIVREIFGVAPQLNDLFCTGPFAQSGFVSAAQRFAQFIAVLSPQIFGPRRALTRFHPSEVAQER
jgi:hypothetical protein